MGRRADERSGSRAGDSRVPRLGAAARRWWLAWPLALVGCWQPDVVRVVDGETVVGRYISADAYAAYARGAEAEARGHYERALAAFSAALDHDDESVELWTRVGALHCRLGHPPQSEVAFERAAQLQPTYEPLWRARAACALRRGQPQRAAAAARRAAGLDPESRQAVLLTARALEESGAVEEAGHWYRAAVVQWPQSAAAWRALRDYARRVDDSAALRQSLEHLGPSAAVAAAPQPRPTGPTGAPSGADRWLAVDVALRRGQLVRARQALRAARLDARMLAARAIALGQPGLAAEQAEHLLAADPADTDSRLTLALAVDLLGKRDRLPQLLKLPPDGLAPSAVGRLLLAELLQRHVDADAARQWLDRSQTASAMDEDEALGDLRRRLRERLDRRAPDVGPASPPGATRR